MAFSGEMRDVSVTVQRSRFYRLGAFAYRRRLWVLGAWLLVFFAAAGPLGTFSDRLSQGGFEVPGSQSFRLQQVMETDFRSRFEFSDLIVLRSEDTVASNPAFRAQFERIKQALTGAPGVGGISDPYASPEQSISRDGHVLTASVGLTDDQSDALKHSPILEKAVERAARGGPAEAYLTGSAPFYKAFSDTTGHDLERAEKIALPITLIILVFAFGSVVAAGVPLVLALFGLALSFGIISVIAGQTTVSSFAQNSASMVGIGVGIDYTLFILTRFRENLRNDRAVSQAVGEAMATSGKAVFVSALTVVVALSGTQLVNIAAFRSMGFAPMITVTLAAAAALTLLPAILGLLGKRVNKWAVSRKRTTDSRVWHRWALGVMRRPWIALAISLGIIVALAAPAAGLRMGSSGPSILPSDSKPRVAAEITAAAFGEGQVAPVQVIVIDPRGVVGPGYAGVHAVAQALAKDPEVTRVDSIAQVPPERLATSVAMQAAFRASAARSGLVSADGQKTLLLAVTKHGPQSEEVDAMVERVRAQLPAVTPAGATVLVGGDAGLNTDILNEVTGKLIPVVGLVLLLSFFVLLLFFRSLLLPIKALLMNTASVLATYGVLVLIFQHGNLEGLLGFRSSGFIDAFLPLFMFCILFGLSMDYEVFMLARIREEYLKTNDNTEAVGWGLEHTARIITSAALIMVTVFGAFAFASLVPIKAMGFGLAVAVFLDATLIRVVMVPATMRLMGHWNWWIPRWLDRILPKVTIDEEIGYALPEPAEVGAR